MGYTKYKEDLEAVHSVSTYLTYLAMVIDRVSETSSLPDFFVGKLIEFLGFTVRRTATYVGSVYLIKSSNNEWIS